MAQQQEITKFFLSKSKRNLKMSGEVMREKRVSVRSVTELCNTPVKIRRENEFREEEIIAILSSDEENFNSKSPEVRSTNAKISSSSVKTEGFQGTPKKHSGAKTPGRSGSGDPESPSVVTKFYSPIKKRSVNKSSPAKKCSPGGNCVTPKKLFFADDELLNEACLGQDDKTKFLLQAVYDVVSKEQVLALLSERGGVLLRQFLRMRGAGARIVCRLYWRKSRWYRRAELLNLVKDVGLSDNMLQQLLDNGLLIQGTSHNMDFNDYTDELLKQEELKIICKNFKLKSQSKKDAIEQLRAYCRSANNITNYFALRHNGQINSNETRVMKMLCETAGNCYRLSEECRDVLARVNVLVYLGLDPEVLRSRQLELLLLNVKSGREAFPSPPPHHIDTPAVVFTTRQQFDDYIMAHYIYEDFLQSADDAAKRISIMQHAYKLFREIQIETFRPLPPWLRRFTPAYLYIAIMEEGLPELKKGKDPSLCKLAVDMLSVLIEQDVFRQHKCASWYDEKALILDYYLHQHNEAAAVLLNAFSLDMTEEVKDALRPRASKLSQQKNIALEETSRSALLAHATKQLVLESALPSTHFHKMPMENSSKGKIVFEIKNDDGTRTMTSVENVAISFYIESGEYTHGRHWEGRIVSTMFFLLFWEIIYTKPENSRGIFLCPYQRYPLDMFCNSFYEKRKVTIDNRLKHIESSTVDSVLSEMLTIWMARPECEQNGITREVGWDSVTSVCRCLGARGVAVLCRRLAQHYRYSHSGFPDLTLWNTRTGKIKFAEVKSDSDKPSMKQIQWVQYLLANGIDAELCYVGTRGPHK